MKSAKTNCNGEYVDVDEESTLCKKDLEVHREVSRNFFFFSPFKVVLLKALDNSFDTLIIIIFSFK